MDDNAILHNITKLVDEEHDLMNQAEQGTLDEAKQARIRDLEIQLD